MPSDSCTIRSSGNNSERERELVNCGDGGASKNQNPKKKKTFFILITRLRRVIRERGQKPVWSLRTQCFYGGYIICEYEDGVKRRVVAIFLFFFFGANIKKKCSDFFYFCDKCILEDCKFTKHTHTHSKPLARHVQSWQCSLELVYVVLHPFYRHDEYVPFEKRNSKS